MIKTLKNLSKKEALFIVISLILIVIQVLLDLKIPDYMSTITRYVQTSTSNMNDILYNGFMMILCSLGSLLIAFIVGYLAAYTGTSFEKNLRKKVFDKVLGFKLEDIKDFSTSSLITRDTNDITQIKMFIVFGIQVIIKAPIMAAIAIFKIAGKEFNFSLITFVGVLVVLLVNIIIILVAVPRFRKIQKLTDNLNEITRESLTGLRVVRAYNAEDYQLKKFDKANTNLTNTHMFTQKLMALMMPVMSSVMSYLSLAIYFFGALMINQVATPDKLVIFSDMVVFSSYAVQVIISFILLSVVFIIYPRASVSMNRVNEVLDKKNKMVYGNVDKDITNLKGVVEFKNVSFKYPNAKNHVLKDISFKVEQGQTIAIIGSTGSGKSTIVNLLSRFYDTTSGDIYIDGVNIKEYNEKYLNDKFGYVSQKAIIFKGSVYENISFGNINNKKVNKEAVNNALDIAQAKSFVDNMDKGINSKISQSGTNISGGQKQRLSIARAIARDPEIYIFDDCFSALDYKTDYTLRKKLNKYAKDKTKFIVAQRIGTIKDADQIIVLDEGKIVGLGTHLELLKNCHVYQEIASSQLSKEEIEHAWS